MKRYGIVLTLLFVATGCGWTGCNNSDSQEAGSDTGSDSGKDAGLDSSFDSGRDSGEVDDIGKGDDGGDSGGKDTGDAGRDAMYPDGAEFSPVITEYDAGEVPANPFSGDFKYMGVGSVWYSFWDDYVFWATTGNGKLVDQDGYYDKSDACFTRISTGKSYCLNVNLFGGTDKDSSIGTVYTDRGKVVWTLYHRRTKTGLLYAELYLYDIAANRAKKISESEGNCISHGINDDEAIFEIFTAALKKNYKYNLNTGEIKPLNMSHYPMFPYDENIFVDGDDLYYLYDDGTNFYNYYYNLATDQEEELTNFDGLAWSMRGGRLIGFSTKYDGKYQPVYYDLKTKEQVNFYKTPYGSWVIKNCSANIVEWQENNESGQKLVVLYDLDTGVRRVVKEVPLEDKFAIYCGPKAFAITTSQGSPMGVMFLFDFEKAGYVKDGHLVPENDGGTK